MGQKWLAGVITAGFILVTPSVVWSQIAGRVQSGSGAALSGATVEIWNSYPSGSILASGSTNAQGVFSIASVAGSTVDMRVRKANFYPTVVRDLPQPTSNTTVRLASTTALVGNPNACDYWGENTEFLGAPIRSGDVVEVTGANGQTCGNSESITVSGTYLVHAFPDDPNVAGISGPIPGENLSFKINGIAASLAAAPAIMGAGFGCGNEEGLVGPTLANGVTLTGPTDATGSAGNSAFVVYSITNSGNVSGNFTIHVELNPGWTVLLSSQKSLPLNLNAGESATIVAEIQIPQGTPDQDVEVRARIAADSYAMANSGAFTTLAVSTTSDVGDDGNGMLPTSFALAQNYPNPFNAGTNITFNLEQSGQVSLTVCNLLGQRVRTLLEDHLEVGIHTTAWDGRDDNGTPVPSGIYFSRLVQNNQAHVRKMVLLK